MGTNDKRIGRPPLSDEQKKARADARAVLRGRIPTTVSAPAPPPVQDPQKPIVKGVVDGDVFKHYIENDFFCVLVSDAENIKYATLKDTWTWAKFKELNHEVMLKTHRTMTKANADAIAADGSWIRQGNIVKLWGG